MKIRSGLIGMCVLGGMMVLAQELEQFAQPPKADPGVKVDIPGTLKAIGLQPRSVKTKDSPDAIAVPIVVNGQTLAVNCFRKPDSRFFWMVVPLRKIAKPANLSKDNLLRASIETTKYAPAILSYDLEGKQFQLAMYLDIRDVEPQMLKWALDLLKRTATDTQLIWDDRKWGRG